jgi:hypothetical protein
MVDQPNSSPVSIKCNIIQPGEMSTQVGGWGDVKAVWGMGVGIYMEVLMQSI